MQTFPTKVIWIYSNDSAFKASFAITYVPLVYRYGAWIGKPIKVTPYLSCPLTDLNVQ